jgi:hypothetical protein
VTYNVLINPNHSLVQAVLDRMIEDEDYFFFCLQASGRVTAFRAEIGQETLLGIKAHRSRIRQSTTTETEYRHPSLTVARYMSIKFFISGCCKGAAMYLGCHFYLLVYVDIFHICLKIRGLNLFPCTINCQSRVKGLKRG